MFNPIRVLKEALAENKESNSKNGPSTDGFVPSNTDRCDQILRQLEPMELTLKTHIKELLAFKPKAQEIFDSTKSVLSVHSSLGGGHTSGTPADLPASHDTASALGHVVGTNPMARLDTTVIAPCERWLQEFHTAKTERAPKVETVRLELDSRRRQESELAMSLSNMRSEGVPSDASKLAKHNKKEEEAAARLAHKQSKLMGVRKTFEDQEAALYQQLRALQQDAELIPAYMAETLTYFKDMFERALGSFVHGSRGIPAATALEQSNHNELWRQANTPNVLPPVMPQPVTTSAQPPLVAPAPHHPSEPSTRQHEADARRNEGPIFPDNYEGHRTPYDSNRAPANYANEPAMERMHVSDANTSSTAAPTPAYAPHHEHHSAGVLPPPVGQYAAPVPAMHAYHEQHAAVRPDQNENDLARAPIAIVHNNF